MKMKKEPFSSNWIDRFRDNDLNEVEKLLFLEYLKHNSELRREFELDQQFDRLMGDADTLEFLEILKNLPHRKKMMKRRIHRLVAAAAVAGILMFGSVYLLIHGMIKQEMTVTTINEKELYDSGLNIEPSRSFEESPAPEPSVFQKKPGYHAEKQNEDDLYQPLQEYEWLVGAEYRDGALELAFPVPDTTIFLDGSIRFRWHVSSGDKDHVTLIIANNKGKLVHESVFDPDTQGVTVLAKTLGPGLFYWKLIVADNIAGMGKMTIFQL
jgi:hypothetical protein